MVILRLSTVIVLALLVMLSSGFGGAEAQNADSRGAQERDTDGPPGDFNARLRGDYALTLSRDCWETSTGFDAAFRPLPTTPGVPFVFRRTLNADHGTVHYNGDGTATSVLRSIVIDNNQGLGSATAITSSESNCAIGYSVDPDLSVAQTATCTFQSTSAAGLSTGSVSIPATRRQITQEGKVVLISSADIPSVETVTVDGSPVPTRYRICTRTGVESRLQGE